MLGRWFGRKTPEDERADMLYRAIVAQARHADLYRHMGVPDTVDGRLEMIFLHCVLVFHRARREGEAGNALAQKVFDIFVTDMDRSLREMGVGDFGVPKRMKAIGKSFYGRAGAYGEPVATADAAALAVALRRNLFPEGADDVASPDRLARYALAAAKALDAQAFGALAAGKVTFPVPGAEAVERV